MANIIDTSFQESGQPWIPSQDIDFMQYGLRDGLAMIIESMIGQYDPTKAYVLKGCEVTYSGPGGMMCNVAPGYIYGKPKALGNLVSRAHVYYHGGSSFVRSGITGSVVLMNIVGFPQSFDPVTFADSSTHNIHVEHRAVFSFALSGSGHADLDELVYVYPQEFQTTASPVDGYNVTLERSKTIRFTGINPAMSTIVIDPINNSRVGAEVLLITTVNTGDTIDYSGIVIGHTHRVSEIDWTGAGYTGPLYIKIKSLGPFDITIQEFTV